MNYNSLANASDSTGNVRSAMDGFFLNTEETVPIYEEALMGRLASAYRSVSDRPESIQIHGFENIAGPLRPDMFIFTATDEFVESARRSSSSVFEASTEDEKLEYCVLQQKTTGLADIVDLVYSRDIVIDARRMSQAEYSLLQAYEDSSSLSSGWVVRARPVRGDEAEELRSNVLGAAELSELTKKVTVEPSTFNLSAAALGLIGGELQTGVASEVPASSSADFFDRMGIIQRSGTLGSLLEGQTQEQAAAMLVEHMGKELGQVLGDLLIRRAFDLKEQFHLSTSTAERILRSTMNGMLGAVALHGTNEAPSPALQLQDNTLNVLSVAFGHESRQIIGHNLDSNNGDVFAVAAYRNRFLLSLAPSASGATWVRIDTIRPEHDEETAAEALRAITTHFNSEVV